MVWCCHLRAKVGIYCVEAYSRAKTLRRKGEKEKDIAGYTK